MILKPFLIAIHSKKSLFSSQTRKSYLLKSSNISKNNKIQKSDNIDYGINYRHEKHMLIYDHFFGV
jgi:hypothetical protein